VVPGSGEELPGPPRRRLPAGKPRGTG
jgi:hypothetical protein